MWHLEILQDGILVRNRLYKNVENAIREIGLMYYEGSGDICIIEVHLGFVSRNYVKEN